MYPGNMEVHTEPTRLFPTPNPDSDDEYMEDKPWPAVCGVGIIAPDSGDPFPLKVESIDFNIALNGEPHHTSEYEDGGLNQLVVRRGQPFDIDINFSRPYIKEKDDIKLIFQFGKSRYGHIELTLSDVDVKKKWGAKLHRTKDGQKTITVRVFTPPTLYVGKWKFSIEIAGKNGIHGYDHPQPIYILFNPWCEDDQVYMHDEALLEEYVLNSTGNLYRAGMFYRYYREPDPTPWNFAQFEWPVLDCTLYLLDELSGLNISERSNPISVVRRLSALANVQDENGVLVGNWSGDYADGEKPTHWNGSLEILEKYFTAKEPVKYGQCWVFSGLVTTLCRTVGIPARSITNFASAHDTNGSVTIDSYFRAGGEKIEWRSSDSVWNFHVWNDVWMARPDLPDGYGGWQAIDGTPQERSDGVYCCGPMSLVAIRRGHIYLPYDGAFVFAEVNADRIRWVEDETGRFVKTDMNTTNVGKYISTNKPECRRTSSSLLDEREDITLEYKHKEGTTAERISVITANASGTFSDKNIYELSEDKKDVKFSFEVSETFKYGESFDVTVELTNTSAEKRTVNGRISSHTTYYTGVNYSKVKKMKYTDVILEPKQSTKLTMKVTYGDYSNKLIDHCCFHHFCMLKVKETKQIFIDEENMTLEKPKLTLKAPEKVTVGKPFNVTISFKNPLSDDLTNCVLSIEGPGIQKAKQIPQNNVKSNQEFLTAVEMTAVKKGKRKIIANFDSKQLEGVVGSFTVVVVPDSE